MVNIDEMVYLYHFYVEINVKDTENYCSHYHFEYKWSKSDTKYDQLLIVPYILISLFHFVIIVYQGSQQIGKVGQDNQQNDKVGQNNCSLLLPSESLDNRHTCASV